MDPEVISAVLGRAVAPSELLKGQLTGYRRVYVAGQVYPVLVKDAAATVEGRMMRGIGGRDAARLDHFEGHQYYRQNLMVTANAGDKVQALVYLPHAHVPTTDRVWHYDDWCRRHRLDYLRRIQGWMRGKGVDSAG